MNELIQIFRDYFELHLSEMRFVDAAKAFKSLVIFLNDAHELDENSGEVRQKADQLSATIPLMNFEEVEKVSAILLYAKRRLASLDQGPNYGSGLSREPTAAEAAKLLALRGTNGNRMGDLAGAAKESDSFIGGLRDDDSGDE